MSATTRVDSADALPGAPAHSVDADDTAAATAVARPKTKPKRPRPCFDDGAHTRVFKFPSKTYPRSTYYVAGDEIIIRIKKARKKWKIVVPKKRLVATNRWFTKPRWVEIELTYTQAIRLGLVQPRAEPAIEAVENGQPTPHALDGQLTASADAEAAMPTATEAVAQDISAPTVDVSHPDVACSNFESIQDAEPAHVPPRDSDVEQEQGEEDEGEEEAETESDIDDAELMDLTDDPASEPYDEPYEEGDDEEESVLKVDESELLAVRDQRLTPPPPDPATTLPVAATTIPAFQTKLPPREPRRRSWRTNLAVAASFLGVCAAASVWLVASDLHRSEVANHGACAHDDTSLACAASIVTGSVPPALDSASAPLEPIPETVPEARPMAVAEPSLDATPPTAEEKSAAKDSSNTAPNVAAIEIAAPQQDVVDLINAAVILPSLPREVPVIDNPCRDLLNIAREISIRFDTASADLDETVRASLDVLSVGLRSCPSVRVIIEGHTDSDGRPNRNEVLSLRRAEAVRRRLIEGGAQPDRVLAFGHGQTRPFEPNITPETKRRNRRVALVIVDSW